MAKKTDPRIERTKRDLRNSLIDLLKEKSFDKITVKDICEHTSINKMTFYHHYQDKYDLLDDCVRDIGERIYNNATISFDSNQDLVAMAASLSTEVVEKCYEYRNEINNITSCTSSLGSEVLATSVEKMVDMLINELEKHITFKYDPEMISTFLIGGYSALILKIMNNEKQPKEKVYELFTNIYNDLLGSIIKESDLSLNN